ncbi:hypothetical protein [Actinoplanes subtropicus]|uniref:hypothetical protein n=1 Tax=Actinoplanes subtropicus TaxID=543632 RepID=UPI0012FA4F0A|nr:hypothetical protein [Actinoplanes subtropicus]
MVKIRALVRGVADGGIAPRAADNESQPPAAPGLAVRYDALPDATGLAPADDDFWSAASRAGGDAALLETLPTLGRRWVELPADGDVTALRASVPVARTRTAHRVALYLPADPAARTAVQSK